MEGGARRPRRRGARRGPRDPRRARERARRPVPGRVLRARPLGRAPHPPRGGDRRGLRPRLELPRGDRAVPRQVAARRRGCASTGPCASTAPAPSPTAEEAVEFQHEVGAWPIVVKPTGGAGSMSVYFAGDPAELLRACQDVLERGLGDVLLEEYVGGTEYAVNGIVDHAGRVLVTEVWRYDRRDSHGERNVYYETLKVSTFEPPFGVVAQYASEVLEVLGLRRSPFHMELKVDEDGPCLIEVGRALRRRAPARPRVAAPPPQPVRAGRVPLPRRHRRVAGRRGLPELRPPRRAHRERRPGRRDRERVAGPRRRGGRAAAVVPGHRHAAPAGDARRRSAGT